MTAFQGRWFVFTEATWCMSTFTIKTILVSLSIGTDRYFSFSYTLWAEDKLHMRMLWCRHGVKQTRNPWSDGPDHITQCRIQPGTNFTYKVIFGEDQEGTLWWHAHSDWTRATVHGAIVILPTQGTTYPFPKPDGEHLLVLGIYSQTFINKYSIN